MNNNIEKRRHRRVRICIPVKYRALSIRGKEDDTRVKGSATICKNLGNGGVRFRTAEFISIATRLILEMNLPLVDKPVRAISKIAWIRKTPEGDDYEVGSYFLEMAKKDRELICEYIGSIDFNGSSDTNISEPASSASLQD